MKAETIEKIKNKSDRELQEALLISQLRSEKHLNRIVNNVVFFFWLAIIGTIATIFLTQEIRIT